MLAIKLVKENDILFNISPIEHALIYWRFLNNEGYLEHFTYDKNDRCITFDAEVAKIIYCFKLICPTTDKEYFYLSSLNKNPDEIQLNIINEYNLAALEYNYDDFINYAKQDTVLKYSTTTCILAKSLNNINDACLENDESSSNSSLDLSSVDNEYTKYMNNLCKTVNDQIVPDILHQHEDEDEFIDDDATLQTTLMLLAKSTSDIDLHKEIGLTNQNRVIQIMEIVNKIDKLLACCNYIQYINNDAFNLEIPLVNFATLPDITMYMKFDNLTFPYCTASVTFDVVFENNLNYIINYLIKNCINWIAPADILLSIIRQIHNIINKHGSIENYTNSEIALKNALNTLSIHSRILPADSEEFADYFQICHIQFPKIEAPISDDTLIITANKNITHDAILCGKLMEEGKHADLVKGSCILPIIIQLFTDNDNDNEFDFENVYAADDHITDSICGIIYMFKVVIKSYPTLINENIKNIISNVHNAYEIFNNKNKNERLTIAFDDLFMNYLFS